DGTGCVHTAPGHGAEDFWVGQQYGIETFCPVDEEGRFTSGAGPYRGMDVFDANSVITRDLERSGRLLAGRRIEHSYPHCWRCKSPLIFRATRQFFLSLEHMDLRKRVLEMVEEIGWHPAWGHERMTNMMAVRPDWCLSRQRAWGVALPVLRCAECRAAVMDADVIDGVADLVEEKGSDVWFDLTPGEIFGLAGKKPSCPECGSSITTRVDDVLDVWFDSSLSHYNVLNGERFGLDRPCSVYLEATDQHRGWFGLSLITSVALGLSRPTDHIITHGLVQDLQGKKMSKSIGNVISPMDIVEQDGADILRMWFAAIDYTADFRADEAQLEDAREAYRKIRNTLRFMLGNLTAEHPAGDLIDGSRLTGLDRYIWLRFRELQGVCRREYRSFQFHRVSRELRNFVVTELSGLYLDVRKDRLYCDRPDDPDRQASVEVLGYLCAGLIRLLAPVIPFTAEEAWLALPGGESLAPSVHLSLLGDEPLREDETRELRAWDEVLRIRRSAMKRLEEARNEGLIGSGLEAEVDMTVPPRLSTSALGEDWADLLIVSVARPVVDGEPGAVSVSRAGSARCERCWKHLPDVGSHSLATDVCGRCASVLESIGYDAS
ncbi:class I tRNA ligase family protein, partial [Candidatus Fermentibacterales bacterium]|nr:class I tRNA ligase family protein [Candidatus Fermentibacterales bacterium]